MKRCDIENNLPGATGFSGRTAGFSLVELLIAMAVGLVVLGAMYSVFTIQNKTFGNEERFVDMQQNVRAAMDMMSREIRMAGYDPCNVNSDSDPSNNFFGVTVNSTQLQLKADLDGNNPLSNNCQSPYKGIDAASQENIIYAFDAANKKITRNIGAGAQSFAENIDAFTFAYLDGNGNVTAVSADVRRISITITGRTASGDRTYSLTSAVALRN